MSVTCSSSSLGCKSQQQQRRERAVPRPSGGQHHLEPRPLGEARGWLAPRLSREEIRPEHAGHAVDGVRLDTPERAVPAARCDEIRALIAEDEALPVLAD